MNLWEKCYLRFMEINDMVVNGRPYLGITEKLRSRIRYHRRRGENMKNAIGRALGDCEKIN